MTRIFTRSVAQTLRALTVLFFAVPGAGVALVAVACGADAPEAAPPARVVDAAPADQVAPAERAPAPEVSLPAVFMPEATPAPKAAAPVAPAPVVAPAVAAPSAGAPAVVPKRPRLTRSDGALAIVDSALGVGVEDRMPVGMASHFGQDVGKVWAWVRVKNAGEPTRIQMVWKREGKVRSRLTLDVGTSSGWRTWSRKTIRAKDTGRWTVEVTGPEGEVLDVMTFDISAGDTAWTDSEGGC